MNFAIFPTDKGDSVSKYVSKVVAMVRDTGFAYNLSAMGTVVETETLDQALEVIKNAYKLLHPYSDRVYVVANFDVQTNKPIGRINGKIKSIESKIGNVNQ
jgi:uncharacterized protein (TIGR00106 family)